MNSELNIRDRRGDNRYFIDNAFLKNWGAKLGPHCIAVYNVLVMHANADTQKAWPSFQTIADLTGMSRRQVMREIEKLEDNHIIAIKEVSELHRESGKKVYSSNIFTLLHPDEWGKLSVPSDSLSLGVVTDSHQPSDTQSPPLVTGSHLNNTNKNKTQLTKPRERESRAEINNKVLEICGYDLKYLSAETGKKVNDTVTQLIAWGATVELIKEFRFDYWWGSSPPTLRQLVDEWSKFMTWKQNPGDRKNGKDKPNGYNRKHNGSILGTGQELDEQPSIDIYTNELVYPDGHREPAGMP